MIVILLFLFILNSCNAIGYLNLTEDYSPVNFTLANATKHDVQYRLFKNPKVSQIHTTESIKNAELNTLLPTKILIHGWTTNEDSPWYQPTKDFYFQRGLHNIVYIDWQKAGSYSYEVSSANAKPVGEFIADFIIQSGIHLKQIHILGHSLGSHVAGHAGKEVFRKTGLTLGRITLLDPAGPKWEPLPSDLRADKGDAFFVDAVHTDDGHYGFNASIGHADFYPNGGFSEQPGCPSLEEDDNCSHARSTHFFMESIWTQVPFKSRRAKSWNDYLEKNYTSKEIIFGDFAPYYARGNFYFKTNAAPPYAQN